MNRMAAAPKPSGRFGRKRHGTSKASGGSIGGDRRPDTRERLYEVPAEALKALRPCVRCFDALMSRFGGTYHNRVLRMAAGARSCCPRHSVQAWLETRRWLAVWVCLLAVLVDESCMTRCCDCPLFSRAVVNRHEGSRACSWWALCTDPNVVHALVVPCVKHMLC